MLMMYAVNVIKNCFGLNLVESKRLHRLHLFLCLHCYLYQAEHVSPIRYSFAKLVSMVPVPLEVDESLQLMSCIRQLKISFYLLAKHPKRTKPRLNIFGCCCKWQFISNNFENVIDLHCLAGIIAYSRVTKAVHDFLKSQTPIEPKVVVYGNNAEGTTKSLHH